MLGLPVYTQSNNTVTYGVAATYHITKVSTDENTRKSDGAEEQLPFCSLLDITVVNDARDDGTGEDTVREGDKIVEEPTRRKI